MHFFRAVKEKKWKDYSHTLEPVCHIKPIPGGKKITKISCCVVQDQMCLPSSNTTRKQFGFKIKIYTVGWGFKYIGGSLLTCHTNSLELEVKLGQEFRIFFLS